MNNQIEAQQYRLQIIMLNRSLKKVKEFLKLESIISISRVLYSKKALAIYIYHEKSHWK